MAYFSERKRLANIAAQEHAGVSLWSTAVPSALRVKIDNLYVAAEIDLKNTVYSQQWHDHPIYQGAGLLLAGDLGVRNLAGYSDSAQDFSHYLTKCHDDEFPNVLEAFHAAMESHARGAADEIISNVETLVNRILESYRVGYSLEHGLIVPFESREMHNAVVTPALTLLANPSWNAAEEPYRNALKDIADGKYERAITAATTALQEGLRLFGCTGGDLKTLMASARSTVFSGFDGKYIDGVGKLIEWSSAVRANKGDVHKTVKAEAQDAWLVVHLVGALLLRLARN